MSTFIDCEFSLLDTQRKYTGIHRKYVIENAQNICYSPETRERISKREAFGYYGHGRRVLCEKFDIEEVDVITLPDGSQAMVSNIPSNITVSFEVDKNGTVKHKQEILDTETGRIVASLNKSKVGGFSWACPGEDGGRTKITLLTGFAGFDYVLAPGFSANRGYVLESASKDLVLESVAAIVGNDKRAEQLVAAWRYEGDRVAMLEDAIFESQSAYCGLKNEKDALAAQVAGLEARANSAQENMQKIRANFEGVLESIRESMPFMIPDAVMHEMLEGDFTRARGIFESAKRFDFSQYPIDRGECLPEAAKMAGMIEERKKPEYGSAGYGFVLNI